MLIIFFCLFLEFRLTSSFRCIHHRLNSLQISSCNPSSIMTIAEQAAREAGKIIIAGIQSEASNLDITSKIGSRDLVTKVDKEVQECIRSTILKAFPDHKFLGEEDIEPGVDASIEATKIFGSADSLWIVDPIDGTTNFAHLMPLSGTIIAYAEKGETLFGCIYDPFRDELFTAWRGQGAFLNGKRIRCADTLTMRDSVVSTGSPPNIKALEACLRATNLISKDVRTVRMLGSAAIMLAWVANGRLTAYFEADLNVWDLAAGALLIEEAGGKVSDIWGQPYELKTRNLVASNGKIHDELLEKMIESEMYMKL